MFAYVSVWTVHLFDRIQAVMLANMWCKIIKPDRFAIKQSKADAEEQSRHGEGNESENEPEEQADSRWSESERDS